MRLAPLLAIAFLLVPSGAAAFCRTSHCPTTMMQSQVCTPKVATDCGFPLWWARPKVTYSVQNDGTKQIPFAVVESTIAAAFATWQAVDCGGGQHPRLEVVATEPVPCAKHEYNKDRGNANIIVFRDADWPYDIAKIGQTTVTYNVETGEIYDADMELNSTDDTFTTSDTDVSVDLLSVVTHEAGHFLGLAHSPPEHSPGEIATMLATYPPNSIDQRTLAKDDRDAICAAHPPGPITDDCDGTPRHGFSPLCAADQPTSSDSTPDEGDCCCPGGYACKTGECVEGGCCTVAPGSGARSDGAWAAAVGIGLLAARRARRSRADRRRPR